MDLPEPDPISEPGWPKPIENGKYRMTLDPDAYEVFMGSKNLQSSRILVGADLHVTADASPLGGSDYPQLPRGFVLGQEDADKNAALLAMVDSMRRVGVDVAKVLIDRGYSQLPGLGIALSQRHIEQAIKLKSTRMGPHGTPIPGAVMIDGGLFADWMPKRLWHLPNFDPWMTTEETAALAGRYDERVPYAFTPKGRPNWERGVQQYRGAWPTCFGIIAVAIRLMRSRYGTSPSLLSEGEQVTEPLPKPMRKDKSGQEKKTLNVQVFGRRKARRKTGRPRGTPKSKPPTGPPTWAVTPPQSAGDSVT